MSIILRLFIDSTHISWRRLVMLLKNDPNGHCEYFKIWIFFPCYSPHGLLCVRLGLPMRRVSQNPQSYPRHPKPLARPSRTMCRHWSLKLKIRVLKWLVHHGRGRGRPRNPHWYPDSILTSCLQPCKSSSWDKLWSRQRMHLQRRRQVCTYSSFAVKPDVLLYRN